MCQTCHCAHPSPASIHAPGAAAETHAHAHDPETGIPEFYDDTPDSPSRAPAVAASSRTVAVETSLLALNDRLAERNRGFFEARGILALNLMSSPGAGKTTLLQTTLRALASRRDAAVLVGDLATDNDARRLREAGAPVLQIVTGTACHLDAAMVRAGIEKLPLDGVRLLFIENVGNLVCPAAFDLGEARRVVLFSTTEGEDKPLKYPPMFARADAVVITKTDLAAASGFDEARALASLRAAAPSARIFRVSARTGEGLPEWLAYLDERP